METMPIPKAKVSWDLPRTMLLIGKKVSELLKIGTFRYFHFFNLGFHGGQLQTLQETLCMAKFQIYTKNHQYLGMGISVFAATKQTSRLLLILLYFLIYK